MAKWLGMSVRNASENLGWGEKRGTRYNSRRTAWGASRQLIGSLFWNEASTSSLFGLVLRYTPSTRRQTARGANSARRSRSLVVQDRKAQLAEARGVGDHVDLDDLAVCDREIEDEEQPTLPGHDESYGSVHQSRSRAQGMS